MLICVVMNGSIIHSAKTHHHLKALEGWEVPPYVLWAVEPQETWWPSLVWAQRLEKQGSRRCDFQSKVKRRGDDASRLVWDRKKRGKFLFSLPFCAPHAISWLDEAHPPPGGPFNLLNLCIQMLTSPRNILTDAPGYSF